MTKAQDINLSEILEREGVRKIERFVNRWSVVLDDGRQGSGYTVGEGLAEAKRPHAFNTKRAA